MRLEPHMSVLGGRLLHTAGRLGWPNRLQRSVSSKCAQGTPAGLPCGMPGMGLLMEGAMQQAAQLGRQTRVDVICKVWGAGMGSRWGLCADCFT